MYLHFYGVDVLKELGFEFYKDKKIKIIIIYRFINKMSWLTSFSSIVRFDAVSIGTSPNQQRPSGSIPSQQRVPEGEKIRKEEMRDREEKFDNYNRPKGERAEKESDEKKREREIKLDKNSRPIGQKENDVVL